MPIQNIREPLNEYTINDLNADTWADFETFFSRYDGVQAGCWCLYYHKTGNTNGKTQEERAEKNRMGKKELVEKGKARSVLIYSEGNLIGSCQYGTSDELPRIGNGRIYREVAPDHGNATLWRITCFFVDKEYRRRGVTKILLEETLKKIREEGGGIVEAYPVTTPSSIYVWFGFLQTFEEAGFRKVASMGRSRMLMRISL